MLERINKKISFPESFDGNVLIFTDLHFHKHKSSNVFLPIIENVLVDIVDKIKSLDIKMVWFLGDWFENKEKIGTEEFVLSSRFLYELKNLGVTTILIPGNHDKFMKSNSKTIMNTVESFNIMDNLVSINEPQTIVYKNKAYLFMPHSDSMKKEELKKMIIPDMDNYFLGHPELNNIVMSNDQQASISNTDVDVDFLNSIFKKSFIGHYHNNKKYDNLISVGSPYQQNFGECDNINSIIIFNIFTDEVRTITNIISPKFKKIMITDLDIKSEEDIYKLDIKNSFVRIILNKSIDNNLLIKLKEILSKDNFTVEILFDYEKVEDQEISQQDSDDLRKKLTIVDLSNSQNIGDFFKTYLDIFKNMPEGIDKEKLKTIIQENI